MTDYRALCAELIEAVLSDDSHIDCVQIARAALAEQPVGPTDEELLHVAAISIEPYESSGIATGEYEPETECAVEVYGSELIAYARAVLARWGQPAAAPVPVSERLPGPEDCDAEGYCWRWNTIGGLWARQSLGRSWYEFESHWLPAHALPVPTVEDVM